MFEPLVALLRRAPGLVVVVWVAFVVPLVLIAPSWESISRDDDVRYFPPDSLSVRGQDLLEAGFPDDAASSQVIVVLNRPFAPLTSHDLEFALETARRFVALREAEPNLGIRTILHHESPVIGQRLIGTDKEYGGQATLVIVSLEWTYLAKRARQAVDRFELLFDELQRDAPQGLRLHLTGSAVVGHDQNVAAVASIQNTTYATITLVVVILLFVYRSPILALIPLTTIAISVFASMKAIAALTLIPGLNFQVINITEIFVVVVLFGAGTDYCLFLISRYREERAKGLDPRGALEEAIRRVAGALVASAGTVICGLGLLYFSTFQKISNTGPAIALALMIALAASLTIAPLLLIWLKPILFWPFKAPQPNPPAYADPNPANGSAPTTPHHPDEAGFWAWVASVVVNRPRLVLAASYVILLPFVIVGAQTTPNYSQLADLKSEALSVKGSAVIQRYFAVGELSPTTLLFQHPTLDLREEEGQKAIARLIRRLEAIPGVVEVRGPTQPLGKPLTVPEGLTFRQMLAARSENARIRSLTEPRYLNPLAEGGAIARLELTFDRDPFGPEALVLIRAVADETARALQTDPALSQVERWGFTGATAAVEDLRAVITYDERQMYWMVTLGVYLILVALIRRPGVCLYLIVTVVLGYLAALGITELVFAWWIAADPIQTWSGLDWKVSFFLFVILIAVGEDYNIFLMSRVIEEQRLHGVLEGTRRAVRTTGGIISSCGLIMAGTFGSMITGELMALKELGFALALGVLLDTFVVRPILVPAWLVLRHRDLSQSASALASINSFSPAESDAASPAIADSLGWTNGWHGASASSAPRPGHLPDPAPTGSSTTRP
ncbi:hypothetical protein Isop_1620 [Isosphaera pallida ATCC 43644]|uniref:Membrane transport protein MMPL domain-containing protein n=1 Tax=Isosphaera pallida (strain ATCC 43644 / DSM 9630 / IS1B) TaxID=575540 RepID=E8QZR8_ISOPI|nr:MMPL family transporter [Isosphaera pallida]ADV62204.1 hypothetical protein Isop_1620 [Isosphaera pallida ATCC 43644]